MSGARARALVLRYGRGWSSVQRATDPVRERARASEPCSPCAAMETAVRVRLSTGRQIGRSSRFGQSDCGALRSSHLYRKDEEQARAQRSMAAYHRTAVVTRRLNWAERFLLIVRKSKYRNSVYPSRGRACPSLIVAKKKKCSWPAQGGTALLPKRDHAAASRPNCSDRGGLFIRPTAPSIHHRRMKKE